MKYKQKKSTFKLKEYIINKILLNKNSGIIVTNLLTNTLTSKENELNSGVGDGCFTLIFSNYEAIDKEILHILIICQVNMILKQNFVNSSKKDEV